MMTLQTKAHLGLLGTNLFFAINLGAIQYFTGHHLAGPYGLNVIRIGISVILFWFFFLIDPVKRKIHKKDIGRFMLCALAALAINQMLFMKGLSYTYSIHAALLILITPIMITFIAGWVLKETITLFKIIGLLLGITGSVILIGFGDNSGKGNNPILGDLLIVLSTMAYTFYFILVKPLMKEYDPLVVMKWVFTFGLIMILPVGWNELVNIKWQALGTFDYFLLFMIVIPGTFLAYIFTAFGIKVLGASVAGTYIYSLPIFAVLQATIFLNEQLAFYKIIAGVLIFGGVYLANVQRNFTQRR